MCHSAQTWAAYHRYIKEWGADISIREFVKLFAQRKASGAINVPKALEAAFARGDTPEEREIQRLIEEFRVQDLQRHEQGLFEGRRRLVDAERKLARKVEDATRQASLFAQPGDSAPVRGTIGLADEVRKAGNEVEWHRGKILDHRRSELTPADSQFWPGYYAPVMISEGGWRVVKPMRYLCRRAGRPASDDERFPGCYNARRDNLERFWKNQFGVSHGVIAVNRFFEHVSRHRVERRDLGPDEQEQSIVLEFEPNPPHDMMVACLWSRWEGSNGEELLSFAMITDEPPAEIAAVGHDRCIIPIRPENVDAWLSPEPGNMQKLHSILDDRDRPYYEHRLAA